MCWQCDGVFGEVGARRATFVSGPRSLFESVTRLSQQYTDINYFFVYVLLILNGWCCRGRSLLPRNISISAKPYASLRVQKLAY